MRTAATLTLTALFSLVTACSPPASAPRAAPPAPSAAAAAPAPAPPSAGEIPALQLPSDVHAVRERIELAIDPDAPRVRGTAELEVSLDRPRDAVWLHGRGLDVTRADALVAGATRAGTWQRANEAGVARVAFTAPLPAGRATLRFAWTAPFTDGTKGLYLTKERGVAYAITQFEAIDARRAFPCFDEPSAKIPYEVTLIVPKGAQAIANTPEVAREPADGGRVRVRFAETKPIPSYLVAFAVGPYDVVAAPDVPPNAVRARPLPLRGVAPRGRGPELAYALAHAGEILAKLEEYFGIPYPYEKLDLLAVPDMSGAMENAGAVTFAEDMLLVDPKSASDAQRRTYAEVVTHELAHQWFGNLVTMRWWNDGWLNEAFATWTAAKIADRWDPKAESALGQLKQTQRAMAKDALVSARAIRQPILSNDDIENVFDDITYEKGAAVLAMFERWLGEETFRKGVRAHLEAHRFANATAEDFLAALSDAAGKDVATPFRTFLERPGVPFVDVTVTCDAAPTSAEAKRATALGARGPRLHLRQERYFPLGSKGDTTQTWQIPFCARYESGGQTKETCALVDAREVDVPLDARACPAWVMPNAHGAGYYRFGLGAADLRKLRAAGLAHLEVSERLAYAGSLRSAFSKGTLPFGDIMEAAAPLASDPRAEVAGEALAFVEIAHDWLFDDPAARAKIEAYARALVAPTWRALGASAAPGEEPARARLRALVAEFLAMTARDPAARAELEKGGRAYLGDDGVVHPGAVAPDLAEIALVVRAESGDAHLFDVLATALGKTEQADVRARILAALSVMRAPDLAEKARALALDPRLRANERTSPLWTQLSDREQQDAAWTWIKAHVDELLAHTKDVAFAGEQLLSMPRAFCDEAHAQDIQTVYGPRASALEGGPRMLASTVEEVHLCAAKRAAQEESAKRYFTRK